jgi:NAD(P)-dependent dehydrogenase (short-subunit alcohol dehydrogenase family)
MLNEDVVIVTGATGNVGAAVCRRIAGQGGRVVAVDRVPDRLGPLLAGLSHPERHLAEPDVDLADAVAAAALADRVAGRLGRIDGLVHTVGGFRAAAIAEADESLWDFMYTVNLKTTLNAIRAVAPAMRAARRGAIAVVAAGAALRAPAGLSAYAASKSAVLRLVESAADELKAEGVRVNAVMPTTIDTPQNRAAMPDADPATWVTVDEVAAVLGFLVSEGATGVTGAAIPITGRG